jgi:transketolase
VEELARVDERVVFVGSDLGPGLLEEFRVEMPDRYFMEGVAEQHVVGMAAGLALEGFIPYVNTIATFLTRRCFEQVALDVCLHNLPVRLIANGGGLVYAPLGPTHLATDDIALMRSLPNMTILAPCDAEEMRRLMIQTVDYSQPIYIRLAKGGDPVVSREDLPCQIGRSIRFREGGDVLVVTTGITLQIALEVADVLAEGGIALSILHCHTVKPLDLDTLLEMVSPVKGVVIIEEHLASGGLGSAVLEALVEEQGLKMPEVRRMGLPDVHPHEYGSQATQLKTFGLTADRLKAVVEELLAA